MPTVTNPEQALQQLYRARRTPEFVDVPELSFAQARILTLGLLIGISSWIKLVKRESNSAASWLLKKQSILLADAQWNTCVMLSAFATKLTVSTA